MEADAHFLRQAALQLQEAFVLGQVLQGVQHGQDHFSLKVQHLHGVLHVQEHIKFIGVGYLVQVGWEDLQGRVHWAFGVERLEKLFMLKVLY